MALSTSLSVVTRSGLSSHHDYLLKDVLSVGVATFSNFKTGSTNVHNVGVEVAGINVFGGDTPIGSDQQYMMMVVQDLVVLYLLLNLLVIFLMQLVQLQD